MYERVKEIREQVHRDGIQQGLEQGLERGRAEVADAIIDCDSAPELFARVGV